MASTRNKNTYGNYCLGEKKYLHSRNYTTYQYSQYGQAYDTKLPGIGLLPGQIPGNCLSDNSITIESFLYGIGSTNLVNPLPPLTPQLKQLSTANIYKSESIYLPEPFIMSRTERPYPIP